MITISKNDYFCSDKVQYKICSILRINNIQNQNSIPYFLDNNLVILLLLNLHLHGVQIFMQDTIHKKHIQVILKLNQKPNFLNKN
jgi:hypothetical protein